MSVLEKPALGISDLDVPEKGFTIQSREGKLFAVEGNPESASACGPLFFTDQGYGDKLIRSHPATFVNAIVQEVSWPFLSHRVKKSDVMNAICILVSPSKNAWKREWRFVK